MIQNGKMNIIFFFKWAEAELFGQAGDKYISQNIGRNIHSCNPPASTLIKYQFPQFVQYISQE